jgi:hypothetical protein
MKGQPYGALELDISEAMTVELQPGGDALEKQALFLGVTSRRRRS